MATRNVECQIHDGDQHPKLNAEIAKQLLGWQEEGEGEDFGKDFTLKVNGKKVRLTNNQVNRPYRPALAARYKSEILRGKWKGLNGTTYIINSEGELHSGQHRLIALILAELERQNEPDKWGSDPIEIEAIIVNGVDPDTADTEDLGQAKTLSDVLYRRHSFGDDVDDRTAQRLSKIVSQAARLVWMRRDGKSVAAAPRFIHSVALELVAEHPGIVDSAQFILAEYSSDCGVKMSLGPAAGLLYLMEHATPRGKATRAQTKKARDFWSSLFSGADLPKDSPILKARKRITSLSSGGADGREEINRTIVKAFSLWNDGKPCKGALKIRRKQQGEKRVLDDDPRLDGLDSLNAAKAKSAA